MKGRCRAGPYPPYTDTVRPGERAHERARIPTTLGTSPGRLYNLACPTLSASGLMARQIRPTFPPPRRLHGSVPKRIANGGRTHDLAVFCFNLVFGAKLDGRKVGLDSPSDLAYCARPQLRYWITEASGLLQSKNQSMCLMPPKYTVIAPFLAIGHPPNADHIYLYKQH